MSRSSRSSRSALKVVLLVTLAVGCGRATRNGSGAESQAGASGNAGGVGGSGGSAGTGGSAGAVADCCLRGTCDCEGRGVVPMQRLRSAEYHNTIKDLFGLDATAPVADERRPYEAVIADAAPWVDATAEVVSELFQQPILPTPFDCAAPDRVDRVCAVSGIDAFALRAFRRPILEGERQAFLKVYDDLAAAEGSRVAFAQVVRAMLLSPAFLFHVELSDEPDSAEPEPLDSYALAARLSFALWRTTPDAQLLAAAAGDLTKDAALLTAYDRLAQDERAEQLANGLSDVWLGVDALAQHAVDASVFPSWNEKLRQSTLESERAFLRRFWLETEPLSNLLTLEHDQRSGLLELPAVLTLTSMPRRTSASLRGAYVLDRLLCAPAPTPPPGGPMDLGVDYPAGVSERQALDSAVASPQCKACHSLFDPIGYALGNFDAIGEYRTVDSQGKPIDASVELVGELVPNDMPVVGSRGLSAAVAQSPRFSSCASQQLASYMLHRAIDEQSDPELIASLVGSFQAKADLPTLSRAVALSDQFRYRRVPVAP
jgi:hypothetical protein